MNEMDFNTKVEMRMAFSDRRNRLLTDLYAAARGNRDFTGYWAERIQALNDAQIALGFSN